MNRGHTKIYITLPYLEKHNIQWTNLARKRPFRWISMKNRLVRAATETLKLQNSSHLANGCRCYMTEILPIRRNTLSNQSINQ